MAATEPPSVQSVLAQTPGQPAQAQHASGFDNLTCQWQGCGERSDSAESLYVSIWKCLLTATSMTLICLQDHVCERHVGRKSTNNLNLQCQWGSCRTTTVKRDHITSHIRVHVPLKPHRCEFCQKTFKRPQDLKKHVKTHAEDSGLQRSPGAPGAPGAQGPMQGFPQQGTPRSKSLTPLLRTQFDQFSPVDGSIYSAPPPQPGYGYPPGTAAQAQMGNGSYGPVYYNMPQNNGYTGLALTEQRKRQHDTLDAFFGDVKRGQLSPSQYVDLGAHFGSMQSLPAFNDAGFSTGFQNNPQHHHNMYGNGGAATATMTSPPPPSTDVNFDNLKTRNDLLSIDAFLEQLQKTVYEHSTNVVRRPEVGVGPSGESLQQPMYNGVLDPNLDRRPSPPESLTATTSTNGDYTAGVTPEAHMNSHSPASAHSQHNHAHPTYPSLPSTAALAQQHGESFMQQASGVPPSGLGDAFENQDRMRRHSGGHLQKAKTESTPIVSKSEKDVEGFDKIKKELGIGKEAEDAKTSDSDLDPSLQQPPNSLDTPARAGQSEDSETPSAQDERLEGWVQNMRAIESLRHFINRRLQHGDYEMDALPESSHSPPEDDRTPPRSDEQSQDYSMEDVKAVAYPSLPKAVQTA
ncbi:MAG: hypothetical protein Q9159_004241 [Coniocarpon cinnabarinum]